MTRFCAVVGPSDVTDGACDLLADPAARAAGFEPVRITPADLAGPARRRAAERLRLCRAIVADVTTPTPAVAYELGRRDELDPTATVRIAAAPLGAGSAVQDDAVLRYRTVDGRAVEDPSFVRTLAGRLDEAGRRATRPVHRFLGDWPGLPHSKTDAFRAEDSDHPALERALADARASDDPVRAVHRVEQAAGDLDAADVGFLVDLLLSYRAASAWTEVVAFVDRLPPLIAAQVLVREQRARALNRAGRSAEAETVVADVLAERGPSPETCSILGRIHKDRMRAALAVGDDAAAARHRAAAVDAYLSGFESDWRDAYPGINAVQLIHRADPADPRLAELVPVVRYAVRRKTATGPVDYWDHATTLELAILDDDEPAARSALRAALDLAPEPWMRETTADTLDTLVDLGAPSWVPPVAETLRPGDRRDS
jgi:hypothetical protein